MPEGLVQSQIEFEHRLSNSRPVIQVENLHKTYDLGEVQVHALRGISLEVYPGEFVAIKGASGSGKATFMNLIGRPGRPTSGTYPLDVQDVSEFYTIQL